MAEITTRRQGEMLRAVFAVLAGHPDGLPAKQVLTEAEKHVPPSEYEQGEYEGGVRRFDKIIRFSTINAVKAGWLIKSRGTWSLTEEGKRAFDQWRDPEDFYRESRRLYIAWKRSQPEAGVGEEDIIEDTPQGPASAVSTLEEAEESAWAEISAYLQAMNPYDFQNLVATLLKAMGYHVGWVAPPGPDRGVDIVAFTDPLGAEGPRIKVQVKRRADRINVDGVRAFMAVLGGQDVGIFISTGGFTSDAEREVRGQETRRLSLIDSERLFDLWVENYDAIPESEGQLLPLKRVFFLAPRT